MRSGPKGTCSKEARVRRVRRRGAGGRVAFGGDVCGTVGRRVFRVQVAPALRRALSGWCQSQIRGHAPGLREAVEHAFQRELAADAALLDAAIGLVKHLPRASIDLHLARLDAVSGAQRLAVTSLPFTPQLQVAKLIQMTENTSATVTFSIRFELHFALIQKNYLPLPPMFSLCVIYYIRYLYLTRKTSCQHPLVSFHSRLRNLNGCRILFSRQKKNAHRKHMIIRHSPIHILIPAWKHHLGYIIRFTAKRFAFTP